VLTTGSAIAGRKTKMRIKPGPVEITPDEAALKADPDAGIEHAVILLEESTRNEDLGTEMQTTYHLRAKILSNEGRDLANIELPFKVGDSRLRRWWARTIQPDGTVLELSEKDIEEQFLGSAGQYEIRSRKAALPGVIPGSIIDFGFEIRQAGYVPMQTIRLHKPWYAREVRYRWEPFQYLPGAYAMSGPVGESIKVKRDKKSVLVTAQNLPPVPDDPYMPPPHETHAAVTLYYINEGKDPQTFWDLEAKRLDRRLRQEIKRHDSSVREGVAACESKGATVDALRCAYAWVQESTHTGDDADTVLAGVVRELGGEAKLVLATDRRDQFWNPGLKRMDQFDAQVLAVGLSRDGGAALVDPSTTLDFGELPWWITGGKGFVATAKGAQSIFLDSSKARNNVAATDVHITFDGDAGTARISWTTRGEGQVGLLEKRRLSALEPDARQARIDRLCGVEGNIEILRARINNFDTPRAEYELDCGIESFDVTIDGSIDIFRIDLAGPWLGHVPDLPEGPRMYPVVFDYPRVDVAQIKIDAPPGYVPGDVPRPQTVESSFGKYQLVVTKQDGGFLVERAFSMFPLTVPAAEYEELRRYLSDVLLADETELTFVRTVEPS
jgi:hypothetical protein